MKKITALILALMLVLGFAACGGGGGGSDSSGGGDSATVTGSKLENFYNTDLADGTYTIVYKIPDIEEPVTCMFDGEYFCISSVTEGMESDVIKNEDGIFLVIHTLQMVMTLNESEVEEGMNPFESEEFDFLQDYQTGTMEMDGKTYDYEEYTYEEMLTRYLFDGDKLVYIISDYQGEYESIMEIIEFSGDVDKSKFVIPENYAF